MKQVNQSTAIASGFWGLVAGCILATAIGHWPWWTAPVSPRDGDTMTIEVPAFETEQAYKAGTPQLQAQVRLVYRRGVWGISLYHEHCDDTVQPVTDGAFEVAGVLHIGGRNYWPIGWLSEAWVIEGSETYAMPGCAAEK
jgi:hypothetical protein